jgi:hypothetical protein
MEETYRKKMQTDFLFIWGRARDSSLVSAPFPEISGAIPSNLMHVLGSAKINAIF